ncbi:MAG: monoacylglycerol lipase [Thermoleophilaceae bacterium]
MESHPERTLVGAGGLELYSQSWLPGSSPRALVVLAHGASEHSGRYDWVGRQLAARGYGVHALDHRGHGRSQGSRALIDRMDRAVWDLDRLVDVAAAEAPGRVFMLGHSMGGTIALSYAIAHQDRLAGLVLSAPLAALEAAPPALRAAGRVLSVLAPRLGVFAIDSSAVSSDPDVVRRYREDPLNHHRRLPARTVAELARAVDGFPGAVIRLRLPLLLMHGTADRLTPIAGSEMIERRAGSADKTFRRYEGFYHEILNEPGRDEVLADLAAWLDEHQVIDPALPR